MKNQVLKLLRAAAGLTLLTGVWTGCIKKGEPTAHVGRYNIEVSLDESLKTSSVVVDLVGINSSSLDRWKALDMGKYFPDSDARRDADRVTLNFVSGQMLTNTMAITDPKWDAWKAKGVTQVLVLVDLPGVHTSKPGAEDDRRQILSLADWNPRKTKTLKVLVHRSGPEVLTPKRSA